MRWERNCWPVSSPLEPGKIRNSNSYMLEGQIRRAGALVRSYGVLPDRFDLCSEAVCKALEEVDILVTTGGASVGDYDFIPAILEKLNAEVLFDKVAMRPGSVTTAAVKEEKWIFGLSGNPASCFVGFELFARPVIRTALGANKPQLVRGKAVLQEAVRESNRFTRFMRAVLRINDERVEVRPVKIDKPGMVTALAEANGLLVIPPDSLPRKGDVVDVLWLER